MRELSMSKILDLSGKTKTDKQLQVALAAVETLNLALAQLSNMTQDIYVRHNALAMACSRALKGLGVNLYDLAKQVFDEMKAEVSNEPKE
jgi:3-dehydroquinate dehydratase